MDNISIIIVIKWKNFASSTVSCLGKFARVGFFFILPNMSENVFCEAGFEAT